MFICACTVVSGRVCGAEYASVMHGKNKILIFTGVGAVLLQ